MRYDNSMADDPHLHDRQTDHAGVAIIGLHADFVFALSTIDDGM